MSFVADDSGCAVWSGSVVWQGCICLLGIQKGKSIAESMFFFSFKGFDHWLFSTFSKAGCIPLVRFFFFSKRHVRMNTHILNVHISSQMYTRVHTQTPDLVFLLSRRSMNKTGVQRLSERQWETWGVLADLSAAVAVCSCHNLHVWTYRISLDAVCSESTHSFANLSVQTCTLAAIGAHVHTHTCYTPHYPRHTILFQTAKNTLFIKTFYALCSSYGLFFLNWMIKRGWDVVISVISTATIQNQVATSSSD